MLASVDNADENTLVEIKGVGGSNRKLGYLKESRCCTLKSADFSGNGAGWMQLPLIGRGPIWLHPDKVSKRW